MTAAAINGKGQNGCMNGNWLSGLERAGPISSSRISPKAWGGVFTL